MRLIVVESPTKSRTISQFLGKEYKVLSSFGHIRDLPKGKLGVDVEHEFQPQYVIPVKAKKTVTALKKEAAKAKEIILATDEDREGEAIAFHLQETLSLKNPQRIVFHEITKRAIQEALLHPRKLNIHLVEAQQARRILDRLVGYKLSPFLWQKVARRLSAGRVQSVAVRLVVEREKERRAFIPQEYWSLKALLKTKKQEEFEAELYKKDADILDRLAIKNQNEADAILKDLEGASYLVDSTSKKQTKRNPLPPFTTSRLQQAAWSGLRLPARRTMSLAQYLYETGLITYHRTDSLSLSQDALKEAKEYISQTYGLQYSHTRTFKTKSKGAQEAHEAIRPASLNRPPEIVPLHGQELKLYDLIWRRFIASQMASASVDSTTADIQANAYTFRATGQTITFDGFLKIYPQKLQEALLPSLEKGEKLSLVKLSSEQHFTQPPARYNEASLVKALETYGVGRPSTYAPILSVIQERNYVIKDEQKRFMPTDLGEVVNDLLVEHFPSIVDIAFTAEMENDLDLIARGKKAWIPLLKEFYVPFEKTLAKKFVEVEKKSIAATPTGFSCPQCGSPLVMRFGKFGKFTACSAFPACKYTESNNQKTESSIACVKCGLGTVIPKKTKRGSTFYGCNRYPECDFALWTKPTGELCKACHSLLVEGPKKRVQCSNSKCETRLP